MGVRARRWQLWLITTFILTGIIGMIQLFKGPESAGAVTLAGGAVNSSVGMPTRSAAEQATQLPAWTPTDDATSQTAGNASSENNGAPRAAVATTRPTVVATGPAGVTSRTQAAQLPSITVIKTTAATKPTSIAAKSITTTAAPTTAKPTTVATTTKAVTTTTATTAKPTPTPVRTTASSPTRSRTQPTTTTRCYRILWWVRCR